MSLYYASETTAAMQHQSAASKRTYHRSKTALQQRPQSLIPFSKPATDARQTRRVSP
ncbi:hypothetical protein M3J09_004585 [Ascochyta lentis]